jgi:hypothetical protein
METVLDLYEKPYDPKFPVICIDERPCVLHGDVMMPIPMKPCCPKREDYHYQRNGTCSIFIAFEAHTGKRITKISHHRTKKDYSIFMHELAEHHYRDATKLVIIQDNLNIHSPGSFYETYSPEKAFRLANRFQMYYTPKKASWLNMVEIEISTLSKQCLDRRIADIATLDKEVSAWTKKRNHDAATINWQFTKSDARIKFSRHYDVAQN